MAESRFEELIEALLNNIPDDVEPQSRIEQILLNCIDGTGDEGLLDPHSRIEAYLKALSVKMAGGSGGGGGGFVYPRVVNNVSVNDTIGINGMIYAMRTPNIVPVFSIEEVAE